MNTVKKTLFKASAISFAIAIAVGVVGFKAIADDTEIVTKKTEQQLFSSVIVSYARHCIKKDATCVVNKSKPLPAKRSWLAELEREANFVFRSYNYINEAVDSWDIYPNSSPSNKFNGDCDDIAVTLQYRLRKWFTSHKSAFFLMTAFTKKDANGNWLADSGHLVLAIETTAGIYVCDSSNSVKLCKPISEYDYLWQWKENPSMPHDYVPVAQWTPVK